MSQPEVVHRRPPPRRVTVVRSERVGRSVQRVTFGGVGLDGFALTSPTGHIKLFLPGAGETEPVLPTFGPNGPVFPEGVTLPIVRTYTPRRFDADRLELEVEFFLHGTGPASTWAERAAVGDNAGIAGQARGYEPDPAADWFLFAGDETAIPALGMLIDALPNGATAMVIVEVESPDHHQELPERAGVDVMWVHRAGQTANSALEDAVRGLDLADGDGRFWVAAEAAAVRRIRSHLLAERHIPASSIVTRGYWRDGEANHPDHDYGE